METVKTNRYRAFIMSALTIIICLTVGGFIADWYNHSIRGNRLVLDHYQTFNVAYIKCVDGSWRRIKISNWSVNSTETGCQVVTTEGIPIYTSFNNIILTEEKENK